MKKAGSIVVKHLTYIIIDETGYSKLPKGTFLTTSGLFQEFLKTRL